MELEQRVHAMLEEHELLQNTADELRERTLVLEKQCHEKDLQVGCITMVLNKCILVGVPGGPQLSY